MNKVKFLKQFKNIKNKILLHLNKKIIQIIKSQANNL